MTDASESIDLDKMRRLAEAATPGPWSWLFHQTVDGESWAVFDGKNYALAMNQDGWVPDAAFIAATDPQTVMALIERVESAERVIERIKVNRSNHPVCELYEGDGAVVCGWKSAVLDIDAALTEGDKQ